MNSFDNSTLRLKQLLGVTKDKEVAELLGLSPVAWAGRKRRGLFPDTELYALIAKRPDLQIDVAYVLTGQRLGPGQADAVARMHAASVNQPAAVQAAAHEATLAMAAQQARDGEFLAKLGAVLPWCDDDARDLVLRLVYYASRRKN